MSLKNKTSSLLLRALELEVILGWPEEERAQTQKVSLDIHMQFPQPPSACETDELDDTHCYDTLVQKIKHHISTRHFRLIENLGYEIYQHIKQNLTTDTSVCIRITKKPAIENLTGGVSFAFGDGEWTW